MNQKQRNKNRATAARLKWLVRPWFKCPNCKLLTRDRHGFGSQYGFEDSWSCERSIDYLINTLFPVRAAKPNDAVLMVSI